MSTAVQRVFAFVLVLVFGLGLCLPVHALDGAWYVGAGAGISRLSPDTDGSEFTLDDDASTAAGVYLGLDINDWLAAEAAFTDLGEATLSGEETIGYSALSIGGIAYVYGERDIRARQQSLSGYVRFGLNSIQNDASIDLNKADNTALWLGAGLQLPMGQQWGLRGELTSYDGDAQALMASIYWRSERDDRSLSTRKSPTVRAPATNPPVAAPAPAPTPKGAADCLVPAPGEPQDGQGCAALSGVLQGVDFVAGSAELTPVAQALLTRLAASLNQYPALVAELQVHTQVYPEPGRAMQLSRARVLTVARYLASQSVDVKRLRARAFGSEQPRADNDTAGGRRLNNRVELRILP